MIRTLIVDDEPFIREGLKVLIDWKQYGYEIVGEAENGIQAIEKIIDLNVDLVITDIKMPKMNGLELIEYANKNINNNIDFIVLSGFSDFNYAKKAIKYNVRDYILKPIQKDELLLSIERIKNKYIERFIEKKEKQNNEKLIYDKYIADVIIGKYDSEILQYIYQRFSPKTKIRYILIEVNYNGNNINLDNEKKRLGQHELYNIVEQWLGNNKYNVIFDVIKEENCYDIGFIYEKKLSLDRNTSEKKYIEEMINYIKQNFKYDFFVYIGQSVNKIENLNLSYKSANIARLFSNFSSNSNISYYDDIEAKNNKGFSLEKKYMDNLIKYIEENNKEKITRCIDDFYESLKDSYINIEIIEMNIKYLLYNLINIAKSIDENLDQNKIIRYIGLTSFNSDVSRGSSKHIKEFSFEFADYISQLKKNSALGILKYIDKEISEHYMEKLSLKYLGEKYFINSAYLGQVFKKHYKIGFKDYLNSYRIDRAEEMLLTGEDKIYKIAEMVGYTSTDYFINKFVELKGKTPLQYRKKIKN